MSSFLQVLHSVFLTDCDLDFQSCPRLKPFKAKAYDFFVCWLSRIRQHPTHTVHFRRSSYSQNHSIEALSDSFTFTSKLDFGKLNYSRDGPLLFDLCFQIKSVVNLSTHATETVYYRQYSAANASFSDCFGKMIPPRFCSEMSRLL